MSEADVYERLAKVEAEVRWIKDKLAERFGMRQGELDLTLAPEDRGPTPYPRRSEGNRVADLSRRYPVLDFDT